MKNIYVGVCGWGDHDLYPPGVKAKEKLPLYAQRFSVVELDSTYHAILSPARMQEWVDVTPPDFRFVVKAYRELTGHGRPRHAPERSWIQLVQEYQESLIPMKESGKCQCLLFQFPPWFDCTQKHVRYIRRIREAFADDRLAIEFRHRSWFTEEMRERTLAFLRQEQLIHVVCDEPQAGETSVPAVVAATHPVQSLWRFHGRNVSGWNRNNQPNWRAVRYAYRYTSEELAAWVPSIEKLQQSCDEVVLLFNNNSQGHAVESAQLMMQQLKQYG